MLKIMLAGFWFVQIYQELHGDFHLRKEETGRILDLNVRSSDEIFSSAKASFLSVQ